MHAEKHENMGCYVFMYDALRISSVNHHFLSCKNRTLVPRM